MGGHQETSETHCGWGRGARGESREAAEPSLPFPSAPGLPHPAVPALLGGRDKSVRKVTRWVASSEGPGAVPQPSRGGESPAPPRACCPRPCPWPLATREQRPREFTCQGRPQHGAGRKSSEEIVGGWGDSNIRGSGSSGSHPRVACGVGAGCPRRVRPEAVPRTAELRERGAGEAKWGFFLFEQQ